MGMRADAQAIRDTKRVLDWRKENETRYWYLSLLRVYRRQLREFRRKYKREP